VYELEVVKDGVRLDYATIAEIHHPDYLGLADIQAVYGAGVPLPTEPDEATRGMLELSLARAARAGR
jgi:hypothetical protein